MKAFQAILANTYGEYQTTVAVISRDPDNDRLVWVRFPNGHTEVVGLGRLFPNTTEVRKALDMVGSMRRAAAKAQDAYSQARAKVRDQLSVTEIQVSALPVREEGGSAK